MRDRLIELMKETRCEKDCDGFKNEEVCKGCTACEKYAESADYLLENGVIVPPCKVGTTIYMIVEKRAKVTREYFRFIKKTKLTFLNLERVLKTWGKTVFLTKEEAEKALKGGVE